jgi:NADH:ubiquinone oxidoreductase subunit 5 (subunit L)/multisubunit Na+/H+ antiporter MnhA subunit
MAIAIINAIPFLLVLLLPAFNRLNKPFRVRLLTAIVAALFVWLLTYLPIVTEQGAFQHVIPWVPQFDLSLSFYVDGLTLVFGLIVTGIGAVVTLYTGYYFESDDETTEFYRLLFLFMGAMLGLVMAGNLLTLFISWELTSVVSFLLIGFKGQKEESARFGAMQALVITGGGGLALLAGLLLLGTAAGSMELGTVLSQTTLPEHPWYTAITILIMIGCFTKSAQFPFHFWLPGSMSAPSPASAYLHSATMVKAGIYLLFRLYPALHESLLWENTLTFIGLTTLFLGAFLALRQRDLKALLAYSTISQLGALVALIGQPESLGLKAALIGILGHALYKATLFLMTGVIEHSTGTRILDKLGGLRRYMPGAFVVVIGAALSMAGIPPLLGFVAKETLLEALLEHPGTQVVILVIVASAAFTVTAALIYAWDVFFGQERDEGHFHASPREMVLGPGLLSACSLIFALALPVFIEPLLHVTFQKEYHLELFHGINQAFLLSVMAISIGVAAFLARSLWLRPKLPAFPSGTQIYQAVLNEVNRLGDFLLRTQSGRLRYYLVIILGSVSILMTTASASLIGVNPFTIQLANSTDFLKAILLVLALVATLASILFKRHLSAALSLGVTGYAIGGLFLLEPAPDVALVQFLVETMGTVLIIIMIGRIDTSRREDAMDNLWKGSRTGLIRDIIIAAVTGVGVAVFALAAVVNRPERSTIAEWYLEHAEEETGVTDIVASIVTDFRGFDTLIEITVFSVAALGVLTLLLIPGTHRGRTMIARRMRWWDQGSQMLRRGRRGLRARNVERQAEANIRAARREVGVTQPGAGMQPLQKPGQTRDNEMLPSVSVEEMPDVPRMSTPLLNMAAMTVMPFALLISISHILYGGFAPGDGFTAGMVSGLGVAVWYVVFGYHEARRRLNWLRPPRLVALGLILAMANALLPLILGHAFLHGLALPFKGPADIKLSSSLIYETAIFLAVFGGVSLIMETIAYPREVDY